MAIAPIQKKALVTQGFFCGQWGSDFCPSVWLRFLPYGRNDNYGGRNDSGGIVAPT